MQVGTAGPQGLNQHQGKKKCLANIEKKRREEKKAKTWTLTLFSFMQRQDEREPTETEVVREAERQEAASSSHIVVSPPAAIPLAETYGEPTTMYLISSYYNNVLPIIKIACFLKNFPFWEGRG